MTAVHHNQMEIKTQCEMSDNSSNSSNNNSNNNNNNNKNSENEWMIWGKQLDYLVIWKLNSTKHYKARTNFW